MTEGFVSLSRPAIFHPNYHSGGNKKISEFYGSSGLKDALERNPCNNFRITFKSSTWLLYETMLRRLSVLWDELWPPTVFVDFHSTPVVLWDRIKIGWSVHCPGCNQKLYGTRTGTSLGWFKKAPMFPCFQDFSEGRCPDPNSLVQCFSCGQDYSFHELKVDMRRTSSNKDVPQPMPLYNMSIRIGGGGIWIGVGYEAGKRMDSPAATLLEGIVGESLRHFDDWYT